MDFQTVKTIVEALAVIIFALLSWVIKQYVIPFIQTKTSEIEYQMLIDFIEKMVRSAKQTIMDNKEKKEFVLAQCLIWLHAHNINISESQLSELIEGIYNAIKIEDKQKE